ncbi:NUDT14.2 family protein [Megaselia abdita]
MEKISKIWLGKLPPDSLYVKPFRLFYVQNGTEKNWDLLKVHDSVSIILFNKTTNRLVFVKQFRPAVYHGIVSSAGDSIENIDLEKYPPKIGVTLELCAGIVDKDLSLVEIAREEVLEECGYDVPVERIEEIMTYRSGVGSSGAKQTLFYCELTDEDKLSQGGGVDDELIDVVEYSIEDAKKLVSKGSVNNSPPSFLFGVLWFLANKVPQ